MNCPKCNTPLSDNAKFCGVCGTPVDTDPQYAQEPRPTQLFDETTYYRNESSPPYPQYEQPVSTYAQPQYVQTAQNMPPHVQPVGYQTAPPQKQPPKKRRIIAVIAVIAVLLIAVIVAGMIVIANRGDGVSGEELRIAKKNFTPPAEAVSIDMSLEDPSNDFVKFTYDEDRQIATCTYTANKTEYFQTYDYHDDQENLEIRTEYKKHIIEIKVIEYAEIPTMGSFVTVDGYYVRMKNRQNDTPAAEAVQPAEAPTQPPTEPSAQPPTEEPTQQPAEDVDFLTLYREYMDHTDFAYTGFCMLLLNDDDIPELLLIEGSTYQATGDIHMVKLCWIENGEVKSTQEEISTMHGEMMYNEREGLFSLAGGSGRASGVYIYSFDGSECKQLVSLGTGNTDTGTEYFVNGINVSEAKYQEEESKYNMKERIPYGALKVEEDVYFGEYGKGAVR